MTRIAYSEPVAALCCLPATVKYRRVATFRAEGKSR
jgi:hypothetical protein